MYNNIIYCVLFLSSVLLINQTDEVFEADIIFDRQEGNTWTVYVTDLDQLITQPFLTREGYYKCPAISPDARYLAYTGIVFDSDNANYTVYIYTFATQTTQTVGPFDYYNLRDGGISCHKVWSPDSEWLLFHSSHLNIDYDWDEYIVRADGTDLRRLTEYMGEDFVAWGADSQSVYLNDSTTVSRVPLDTMEREVVFENLDTFYSPQISPDDTYLYTQIGYPYTIQQSDLHSGTQSILFQDIANKKQGGWLWSPDGNISAISLGKTVYALQDGELWQAVYETTESIQPLAWLPDNHTLIMAYGDTNPWLVTVDVEKNTFDEIDFLRHGILSTITSDGEWLVFLREHPDGYEIYRMHPEGSDIAPIPDAIIENLQRKPSVLPVLLNLPFS